MQRVVDDIVSIANGSKMTLAADNIGDMLFSP